MEIILKQDIEKLGYADEIVKVKDGYARNYLIPQGFAIPATESNKKMLAETLKQRAFKAEKIRKEAEFMAGKIEGLTVKILTKASEKPFAFIKPSIVTSIDMASIRLFICACAFSFASCELDSFFNI